MITGIVMAALTAITIPDSWNAVPCPQSGTQQPRNYETRVTPGVWRFRGRRRDRWRAFSGRVIRGKGKPGARPCATMREPGLSRFPVVMTAGNRNIPESLRDNRARR